MHHACREEFARTSEPSLVRRWLQLLGALYLWTLSSAQGCKILGDYIVWSYKMWQRAITHDFQGLLRLLRLH